MKKSVTDFAMKAGKTIIALISKQIIKYLSSEEFSNRVKEFIQEMVSRLVKIVMSEKMSINK